MGKVYRKCATKASCPDPFLIMVNSPKQPAQAKNSFAIKILMNRLSKNLKKFFLRTQSLFMEIIKNKRSLELVNSLVAKHV